MVVVLKYYSKIESCTIVLSTDSIPFLINSMNLLSINCFIFLIIYWSIRLVFLSVIRSIKICVGNIFQFYFSGIVCLDYLLPLPPPLSSISVTVTATFNIFCVIVYCFYKRIRDIIGIIGVCKVLVGVQHFLLIKVLKIFDKNIETHSWHIWCDLQPPISHNVFGATAHKIIETIYLQCILLLILQTWNITASKYCKGIYIFTEGSWGEL